MFKTLKNKALFLSLIITIFSIFSYLFVRNVALAQVPSGVPFSGIVIEAIPPSLTCPFAHAVIFNYNSLSVLGIAIVPGSQIYRNGNLASPGAFVLGTFAPITLPCLLFYPLVPISQVGTS